MGRTTFLDAAMLAAGMTLIIFLLAKAMSTLVYGA